MAKFRIVQKGENRFYVEEKGWFFWSNAAYGVGDMYGGMYPMYFNTAERAKEWMAETIEIRRKKKERDSFKERVVDEYEQ